LPDDYIPIDLPGTTGISSIRVINPFDLKDGIYYSKEKDEKKKPSSGKGK
jgi:hypothetical protein